jgi:hypothetical protein
MSSSITGHRLIQYRKTGNELAGDCCSCYSRFGNGYLIIQKLIFNANPTRVPHAPGSRTAHAHYNQLLMYWVWLKVLYPLPEWLHLWPVPRSVDPVRLHSSFQKPPVYPLRYNRSYRLL